MHYSKRAAPVQWPFLLAARACFTCGRSLELLGWIAVMISSSGTVLMRVVGMSIWHNNGLFCIISLVWSFYKKKSANIPNHDHNKKTNQFWAGFSYVRYDWYIHHQWYNYCEKLHWIIYKSPMVQLLLYEYMRTL